MRLFKPTWVSHNGQPIFSIDIHPDGSRFATGGQGDGGSSGKVVIWNMTPVCTEENENNGKIPKLLCVMENHLACVNCVRWSCNGRYLASGGDDRLIMIWQFAGYGAAGVFGSSSTSKTSSGERWRCCHTLKGHTGDVLDLAWSPANQWLASCSIDNTVVIWNVEKFPEITTVLKGHTSLVKGVTWDPVGSYVATQSDDKSVKIWKTLDWKLETTITKPFEECTATTHVLRLSWSPDGGYLVSAHAMNNSGPTAQIVERSGWKTEMDFVGHRKAITCTRFNGCVFKKTKSASESDDSKSLPYTCCAVGSRDRSLSIWLTSLRRPLVVIHDMFENSIMDISWSFLGYYLLCCSWDGTIAYIRFTPEEIGQTLTQEEKNKLHKDTYGKSSALVSQPLVIENPAMLAMQEKKNDYSITNGVSKEPAAPMVYPTKQIETRTSSGKRRIIPVFVAPQEALGGIPKPFGSSTTFGKINSTLKPSDQLNIDSSSKAEVSPTKSNSVAENSRSAEEKKTTKEVTTSDAIEKVETTAEVFSNLEPKLVAAETPEKKHSPQKQIESASQSKKAVLDIRLCEKTKPLPPENKTTEEQRKEVEKVQQTPPKVADPKPSSEAPSADEEVAPVMPRRVGRPSHLKRKQLDVTSSPAKKKHKQARKDRLFANNEHPTTQHTSTEKENTPQLQKSVTPTSYRSANILPAPKLTRKISMQVPSTTETAVAAENEVNSEHKVISGSLHKITCTIDKQESWLTVLSSPVMLLHASKFLVCCVCRDHTIHVFSLDSGRRVLPPLCFGTSHSTAARLCCRDHHVMAVDTSCNMTVWDTKSQKSVVDHRSFSHLIPDHHRDKTDNPVRQCSLTERGFPLVTTTDGKSYSFNVDLSTWMLVASTHSAVEHHSEKLTPSTASDVAMTSHEKEVFSILNQKPTTGSEPSNRWLCSRMDESFDNVLHWRQLLCFNSWWIHTLFLKLSHNTNRNRQATDLALHSVPKTKLRRGFHQLVTPNKASSETGAHASRAFHASASTQRNATLAMLEHKVASCVALQSLSEYRKWLLAYVRFLVQENHEVRLREVCDELIGPPNPRLITGRTASWKPHVMGMQKRTLLQRDILPVIASNLSFQRLYTEYQDQLDQIQLRPSWKTNLT